MKAIGYIRVSTVGQAEDGVSLDAQRQKIEAWATANGAELLDVFSDNGVSGSRRDRPGLVRAIAAVKERKAALVVYSLSRFSRSTKDTLSLAETLEHAGADLVSLSERIDTTTAAGKMVFRMLAVLNEFERDQVSERTRAALSYKRSLGQKTGGLVPYGFQADADGMLSKDPAEQKTVSRILELRGSGLNYSAIARRLNALSHRTKMGRKWFPQTVKNVVLAAEA
ncbi:MAG: recombinase family protein [Nitrospinae bacterium]|nr:recombinase family protein [Nitrospinota bacterium]